MPSIKSDLCNGHHLQTLTIDLTEAQLQGNISGNEQYLAHKRAQQNVNNLLSFLSLGAMPLLVTR